MRLRATVLALGASAALTLQASQALAHAPVEITQVVSYQRDEVLLATNRGIIVGQLMPRAFALICSESMNLGLTRDYRLAKRADGALLLATQTGLYLSPDRGCTWMLSAVAPAGTVADMAQHPDHADTVWIATRERERAVIQVSLDGGTSFRSLLTLDADETVRSLRASRAPEAGPTTLPREAAVLYASGYRGTPAMPSAHFVLRSEDRGESWQRFEHALPESERDLTLLAIDPKDPMQLFVRASAWRPELGERAFYSRDGGASLQTIATLRLLRSALFTPSGALLAGVDGVFRAQDRAGPYERVGLSAWVSDVEQFGEATLASGYYDGIDVPRNGMAQLAGDTFTPWFSFAEVTEVASCPMTPQLATTCALPFRDFRLENAALELPTLPVEPDAGPLVDASMADVAVDAAADAAPTRPVMKDAEAGVPHDAEIPRADAAPTARSRAAGCALHKDASTLWWLLMAFALNARRAFRQRRVQPRAC